MLKQIRNLFCGTCLVVLFAATVWSQAIFATLTGIVSDSSGAVVANAKVTLRNSLSGDVRESTTDSQGYYTFASVPVGTYNVTIEAPGFQSFKVNEISMGGGERRNVNASLQVGSTNQTVEVTGTADILDASRFGRKSGCAHHRATFELRASRQQCR